MGTQHSEGHGSSLSEAVANSGTCSVTLGKTKVRSTRGPGDQVLNAEEWMGR